MAERRETNRERRERLKVEHPTPPASVKGRRRFAPKIVGFVSATLLLTAGIAGAAYAVDQNTPYSIPPQDSITLIGNEITAENLLFDPHEAEIWDKADRNSSELSSDNPEQYRNLMMGIVRQTMHNSKNPYFNEAIDYIDKLMAERTLSLAISPASVFKNLHAGAQTEGYYVEAGGRLTLVLRIPINNFSSHHILDFAEILTHERKHMEQYKNIDQLNSNLFSTTEKIRALKSSEDTSEKLVKKEAEAYAVQARAYVTYKGLTNSNLVSVDNHIIASYLIKSNNNHNDPKFLAFIANWISGKTPPEYDYLLP